MEYIVGTQQSSTNVWTGTSLDMQCLNSTLYVGKVIIYHLPYNGNTSPATLNLTLADNSTTGPINVKYLSGTNVTNEFSAGYDIFMIYDGTQWKTSASGTAKRSLSIPFAKVDSTSTATAYTATVPGITELVDGTCVMLENGVVTSAAGFTLNINGLGAKPVFNNLTAATRDTTIFNVNYTMLFVYDSNRVVDGVTGAWCCYRGYDANTNTIGYQLRSNSYSKAMTDITYRYRLLFSSADNSKWVPANTSTSTNATSSRAVCQTPINPFGEIVYYSTTASVAAGSRPSATNLWQQYTLSLGYSFNRTGAALELTSWKPVYVKCAPQANGSAIMDATTPYVQDLPTTDDGKIYIFLGVAYNATSIELLMNHPVFYYKDGAIRQWSNAYIPAAVQSNWNETDTSSAAYIQNKPTIPDDSNLVHTSGNEPIGGQKTFSSTIVANGGIDVGQGTVSSEDSQDFSYITTGGGDTLQDALDAKQQADFYIVNFTENNDIFTADKTFDQIIEAVEDNKVILGKWTYIEEGESFTTTYANVFASDSDAFIMFTNLSGLTGKELDSITIYSNNTVERTYCILAENDVYFIKQDTLVSGTNIKTVNNISLLGSGNVSVGTITGITMNGSSKGTSGVVDLGTVLTAHQDISGKADINSPALTGTPTAPTAAAGTNTTQIATTAFVQSAIPSLSKGSATGGGNAVTDINVSGHTITPVKGATYTTSSDVNSLIATAISDITSFDYQVVQTLPATGVKGTIYLVLDSDGSGNDIYKEYIYVNNSWELLGHRVGLKVIEATATVRSNNTVYDLTVQSGTLYSAIQTAVAAGQVPVVKCSLSAHTTSFESVAFPGTNIYTGSYTTSNTFFNMSVTSSAATITAIDDNAVHRTGNENIAGNKTFNDYIRVNEWANIYNLEYNESLDDVLALKSNVIPIIDLTA